MSSHHQDDELAVRADHISQLHDQIDQQIAGFASQSGLACPSGCGRCCEAPTVETSVADWLPTARRLVKNGEADSVIARLDALDAAGDAVCHFYSRAERLPGRCTNYAERPMLCRLFGFAARRDRLGEREHVSCTVHKEKSPDVISHVHQLLADGAPVPEFHTTAMQLMSLEPELSRTAVPINHALREAIMYVGLRYSLFEQ